MRTSRPGRLPIAPALLAAVVIFSSLALVAATPTPVPSRPTPAQVFKPVRVRTETLTAIGLGTVEAPFSPFRTTTTALRAEGLGTVEAPFKPVRIRTQPLKAAGAATGGPK
jgi:hypothetical protein